VTTQPDPALGAPGPSDSGSDDPAVVFVDSYSWQSFADLAGALRHRGIPAARITGRAASARQRAVMALESLVYGPSVQLVDGGVLEGRPATISPGALAMAVGPTTRDVQMQDDLVIPALDSGPCAANPLRRVAPGVDPMVLVDKRLQEESARHAGVPVLESWPTRETAQLPAVVKPAVGFGGDDVTVVHDADALDRAWREVVAKHGRPPVVQRLLAQGMSTAGVATHGEPVLLVSYQGTPASDDPTGPSESIVAVRDDVADRLARDFLADLGYTGIFCIDWARDADGGLRLIDFNARAFGSWVGLQDLGFDVVGAYLYVLGLGPRPDGPEGVYGEERSMLRYPCPAGLDLAGVRAWRRTSVDIIRTRRAYLGGRWAGVMRLRTEIGTVRAALRRLLSRRARPDATDDDDAA
jgi:hypothetical protein